MISNYILILSFGFLGTTLELMSMEMFPGTTAAVSAYGSPVCQKAAAVSADHSRYSSPLPVGDMNSMVITTPFGLQLSPIPLGLQLSPIPHMTLSPASGNATASPASRGATASPTVYAAIQTSFGSTDAESTMTDSSLMSPLSSSAGAGSSASIKITNLTNPNVQTSKKERQQKSNDQALKALKGKLGSPSFMNEPNLNVVQTIFSSMCHNTGRQTKKQAAKDIATALNGAVIAGAVDEEGQNLQLSKFLQDPSATNQQICSKQQLIH